MMRPTVPVELTEVQVCIVVVALSYLAGKEAEDGKYDDGRKTLAIATLLNEAWRNTLAQKMSELVQQGRLAEKDV